MVSLASERAREALVGERENDDDEEEEDEISSASLSLSFDLLAFIRSNFSSRDSKIIPPGNQ